MTRPLPLTCHPDTPCASLRGITARASRIPGGAGLALEFVLEGEIASLRVPAPAPLRRVAGLWQHTCLEAFVGVRGADSYLELNLAPSGEWAAWWFEDYRAGMREADVATPRIEAQASAATLVVRGNVDLASAPSLAGAQEWQVGLTAVVEEGNGTLSYWALAHAPGRPDFHAAAGRLCVLQGKLVQ